MRPPLLRCAMVLDEADLARLRRRLGRSLDGRWQVVALSNSDVGSAVCVFRGAGGHREAEGSSEAFEVT